MERSSKLPALITALRPGNWAKNIFVLAALVFAERFTDPSLILRSLAAFFVFCSWASAVYLFNDIADRDNDRLHPRKRNRPIAAGKLGIATASTAAAVLVVGGLAAGWMLAPRFALIGLAYLGLNLAYSLGIKRIVILDVMIVSAGFLLRAWAGAVVLDVEMSHWLVLCTGALALFISLVKRRQEIADLGEEASLQRPSLQQYSLRFLDQVIPVVTAATLIGYALYVFSPEVARKLGTPYMGWTFPFVLFGLFRYLFLVHLRGQGDDPTGVFLKDVPLLLTVAMWAILSMVLLAL